MAAADVEMQANAADSGIYLSDQAIEALAALLVEAAMEGQD